MENPTDLKYSKDHEWLKVEGNIGTVGITDHAQKLLTDIVFVELPSVGKKVDAHGQLAVVESVKSVSDVYAPISGEVIEVNENLSSFPELVNKSAFADGWIAKIKLNNPAEAKGLLSAAQYEALITRTN